MTKKDPRSKLHSCPLRYHEYKPNVYLFSHRAVTVTSSTISLAFMDKNTSYRNLLQESLEAEDTFHEHITVFL